MKVILIALVVLIATLALGEHKCPGNLNVNEIIPCKNDPSKYYKCFTDGIIREIQCKQGLQFDEEILACILPLQRRQLTKQSQWISEVCNMLSNDYIVPNYEDDCSSYIICQNKQPIIKYCGIGYKYNFNVGYCDHPINVNCQCLSYAFCPKNDTDTTTTIVQETTLGSTETTLVTIESLPTENFTTPCGGCWDGERDTTNGVIEITPPPSDLECVPGMLDTTPVNTNPTTTPPPCFTCEPIPVPTVTPTAGTPFPTGTASTIVDPSDFPTVSSVDPTESTPTDPTSSTPCICPPITCPPITCPPITCPPTSTCPPITESPTPIPTQPSIPTVPPTQPPTVTEPPTQPPTVTDPPTQSPIPTEPPTLPPTGTLCVGCADGLPDAPVLIKTTPAPIVTDCEAGNADTTLDHIFVTTSPPFECPPDKFDCWNLK